MPVAQTQLIDDGLATIWREFRAEAIAEAVRCHMTTVRNVRRLFVSSGLRAAIYDTGRPGAKPKSTGQVEAKLTMPARSQPPEGHARWTLRLPADQMVDNELKP